MTEEATIEAEVVAVVMEVEEEEEAVVMVGVEEEAVVVIVAVDLAAGAAEETAPQLVPVEADHGPLNSRS